MATVRIEVAIVDHNGSFARFLKQAPKVVRAELADAVERSTFALRGRIAGTAPVGPDAPHIKERVEFTARGLSGQAGYLNATEAAAPGSSASTADVALYNEYRPNKQPFMRPAAEAEASSFKARALTALAKVAAQLTVAT